VVAKEDEKPAEAAELTTAGDAPEGTAVPVESCGNVAVQMREVGKLAEVENLRWAARLIIEPHHDWIQVRVRGDDGFSYGVAFSTRAHWSV